PDRVAGPWLRIPRVAEASTLGFMSTTASRLLAQRRCFLHLKLMWSFKLWIIISLMVLVFVASSFTVMAQKRKTTVDLIIRGGTVVTMDGERHVIANGAV